MRRASDHRAYIRSPLAVASLALVATLLAPACGGSVARNGLDFVDGDTDGGFADANADGTHPTSADDSSTTTLRDGASTVTFPGDDAASDGGSDDGGLDVFDAVACPDAPLPPPDYHCDPLKPPPGDCPAGQACTPSIIYPTGPCEPERYTANCGRPGKGVAGDPCTMGCGAGMACFVTGAGNQCLQFCKIGAPGACADGNVCEPSDLPGIGVCF